MIIILVYEAYLKEALNILLDSLYSEKISGNPFPDLRNRFRVFLNEALTNYLRMKDEYRFVNIMVPNDPFF